VTPVVRAVPPIYSRDETQLSLSAQAQRIGIGSSVTDGPFRAMKNSMTVVCSCYMAAWTLQGTEPESINSESNPRRTPGTSAAFRMARSVPPT
jgi:hypothetical protein